MQFKSLKVKLLLIISGCSILFIGVLLAVSINFTRTAAIKTARVLALEAAKEQALLIKQQFNDAFTTARTLAQTIEGLKQANATPDREEVLQVMKQIAVKNSELYGVWLGTEPMLFDGKDSQYRNDKKTSNSTGQFIPYWNKPSGQLTLMPCGDMNGNWYTASRDSREDVVTNVSEYTSPEGEKYYVSSLSAPIIVNNTVIGVAGVDLSVGFLKNIVNNVTAFNGHCAVGLIGHDGILQAVTNRPNLFGTRYADAVEGGNQLLQRAARGETVVSELDDTLRVVVPLSLGKAKEKWAISLSVPMDVVFAKANSLTQTLLITGIAGLLVALAGIFYLVRVITRPIIETSSVISKIAEGDLTVRCHPKGQDEIAEMQNAVNTMASTLKENLDDLDANMKEVQLRSEEAEKATAIAEEAQQETQKARREGQLAVADQLKTLVEDLTSVSEELHNQIGTTADGVKQQDSRNSETATAMEEMNSTILEVSRNASEAANSVDSVYHEAQSGLEVVEQSVTTIQNVHTLSEHLKNEMGELGTQVESISDILNVISDIADQTNLLALNAAIEAARAGDAGRGFAVVADEVRKLAENTMEATSRVGTAIQTIQSGTQQNIDAMTNTAQAVEEATQYVTESGNAFGRIVTKVTPATDQVRAIATAAEQQSAASEEITQAVDEISHISNITAENMHMAETSVNNLGNVSESLTTMMEKLYKG
ncbi:methyl-accepting chemotaxis protein [Halodesulfovibrio sp.]|jgi:methyl-accepting chemotaxis protein|uniref:methyl-accepting chemotaxis protein n=1 Tax=Halodesulfovibrio sp. TaxID=1912772 RepID=UPI0025FBFD14|nr:methyl-accepting chemotaxis protein [Halodesulfovibrio sp.]MCT4535577.1 methyl-accepting chemotaxis protein [Halodesulfovibrio sp.]